jgi:hypothetical protein
MIPEYHTLRYFEISSDVKLVPQASLILRTIMIRISPAAEDIIFEDDVHVFI